MDRVPNPMLEGPLVADVGANTAGTALIVTYIDNTTKTIPFGSVPPATLASLLLNGSANAVVSNGGQLTVAISGAAANKPITWSVTPSSDPIASLLPTNVSTDASGNYSTSINVGTTARTGISVGATVNSVAITPATFDVSSGQVAGFTLQGSTASVSAGNTTPVNASVTVSNIVAITGTIAVTLTPPAGITLSSNTMTLSASTPSATVGITVASGTAAGTLNIGVSATGGSVTQGANIAVTVTAAQTYGPVSFSMTAAGRPANSIYMESPVDLVIGPVDPAGTLSVTGWDNSGAQVYTLYSPTFTSYYDAATQSFKIKLPAPSAGGFAYHRYHNSFSIKSAGDANTWAIKYDAPNGQTYTTNASVNWKWPLYFSTSTTPAGDGYAVQLSKSLEDLSIDIDVPACAGWIPCFMWSTRGMTTMARLGGTASALDANGRFSGTFSKTNPSAMWPAGFNDTMYQAGNHWQVLAFTLAPPNSTWLVASGGGQYLNTKTSAASCKFVGDIHMEIVPTDITTAKSDLYIDAVAGVPAARTLLWDGVGGITHWKDGSGNTTDIQVNRGPLGNLDMAYVSLPQLIATNPNNLVLRATGWAGFNGNGTTWTVQAMITGNVFSTADDRFVSTYDPTQANLCPPAGSVSNGFFYNSTLKDAKFDNVWPPVVQPASSNMTFNFPLANVKAWFDQNPTQNNLGFLLPFCAYADTGSGPQVAITFHVGLNITRN